MSVSPNTNRLQATIDAVWVNVSHTKRLQTVARFEKNDRMTPLVGLTISFWEVTVFAYNREQRTEGRERGGS